MLGNATFILSKEAYPNAAKQWMDFQWPVAGQTNLSKKAGLISSLTGFTSPLPEYASAIDFLKLIPKGLVENQTRGN